MIKRKMSALQEAKNKPGQSQPNSPNDELLDKMREILKQNGIRFEELSRRKDGKIELGMIRAPFSVLQKIADLVGDNFACAGGQASGLFCTWQPEPSKVK